MRSRMHSRLLVASFIITFFLITGLCAGQEWYTTYAEAQRASQADLKPIIAVYMMNNCGWCERLKREVLPKVGEELGDRCILLMTNEDPPRRRILRNRGRPYTELVRPNGALLTSIGGFKPAEEFVQLLADSLPRPVGED